MQFFPMLATGALIQIRRQPFEIGLSGTCFAYRSRKFYLTASHCVPEGCDFVVATSVNSRNLTVEAIARHPTSDVAVLKVNVPDEIDAPVYGQVATTLIDGGDFVGYGYPVEGSSDAKPIGRLFKGHVQRLFSYQSSDVRLKSYLAAELSIPAPGGFSGGPIAWENEPSRPSGVVTTNHDSWMTIDQFQEVEKDGTVYREEIRRVIAYEIAAMLVGLDEWIESSIDSLGRS